MYFQQHVYSQIDKLRNSTQIRNGALQAAVSKTPVNIRSILAYSVQLYIMKMDIGMLRNHHMKVLNVV
jgi:hypothetical protein